jgi:hypothetical protein
VPPHPRLAAHATAAATLAAYSDRTLQALVEAATPAGTGIGGRTALLDLDGARVFVKRVPLTAYELRPQHTRSTANVFGLPMACQYGFGAGPSFGAWRELAVHEMATRWVLEGAYEGFPLLYHWRVLPDESPLPEELADIERTVAYWGGSRAVRRRIEALRDAPASVALFLECLPYDVDRWLTEHGTGGPALAMVERELAAGTAFMNGRGLLHFDAHFGNILTDGRRLYFSDFGLSLSSRFELSPAEAGFLDRHRCYDRRYTTGYLGNWLAAHLTGSRGEARDALLRACAEGEPPAGIPAEAVDVLARSAADALMMSGFAHRLRDLGPGTPYPPAEHHQVTSVFPLPGGFAGQPRHRVHAPKICS